MATSWVCAKYLKLYAHNNGNESSDHAVYANAKLIKEDYVEDNSNVDFIKTIEQYDSLLANTNVEDALISSELVVLQREFVRNIGYDILQSFVRYNDSNKEAISWLMNDLKNLKLYITGGAPEGSYMNSIKVLAELHKNYKEDFNNTEVTKYGTVLGDLYTRMAIAMSLTHSQNIGLWLQSGGENKSDALRRYQTYKDMHKNGNFIILRNSLIWCRLSLNLIQYWSLFLSISGLKLYFLPNSCRIICTSA